MAQKKIDGNYERRMTRLSESQTQIDTRLTALVEETVERDEEGTDSIVTALRIKRNAGALGVASRHTPDSWDTSTKEHFVWTSRLYAAVDKDMFEKWLSKADAEGFSRSSIRKKAEKLQAEKKRAARRARKLTVEGVEIYQADIYDITKLRLGQPAAVITDPPYEKACLPLWGELIRFADRVLPEHGWLLAMSGQRWLPDTLEAITQATAKTKMRYCWTICMHTPGAQSSQGWISQNNPINVEWKPIFVYSKGTPPPWPGVTDSGDELPDGLRDYLLSEGNDKEHHVWGQPMNVVTRLVEEFVAPEDLVVDPFLGGGTTIAAAHAIGRAAEGFDIDEQNVITSIERVAS